MDYKKFIEVKSQQYSNSGFKPTFIPDTLFDFQKLLVEWSVLKGRSAIFADCGMGKTFIELVWAQNIIEKTNKPILILTPLAVSFQTEMESQKFNIDAKRVSNGELYNGINITNYEQLHKYNFNDFSGVVCDESSILKNFDGKRKSQITQFMRKLNYRLLATATAAPNDYIELGTSSEALGYLGFIDMLNRFFKNDQNNSSVRRHYGEAPKWRFKGHSEIPFWRWVTGWAKACRMPSDLGYDDNGFILPQLIEENHLITDIQPADGKLFNMPAFTLEEQRGEVRRTIKERCGLAAALVKDTNKQAIIWCHLNEEGRILKNTIPDSLEISGSDNDEKKVDKFISFLDKKTRVLITKPKIGAWGLNLQQCDHIVYFPSHSYEQYYQAIRRCWRFGQKNSVKVDIILTEGEKRILQNLKRKSNQADKMFTNLISEMNNSMIFKNEVHLKKETVPSWL